MSGPGESYLWWNLRPSFNLGQSWSRSGGECLVRDPDIRRWTPSRTRLATRRLVTFLLLTDPTRTSPPEETGVGETLLTVSRDSLGRSRHLCVYLVIIGTSVYVVHSPARVSSLSQFVPSGPSKGLFPCPVGSLSIPGHSETRWGLCLRHRPRLILSFFDSGDISMGPVCPVSCDVSLTRLSVCVCLFSQRSLSLYRVPEKRVS